MSPVELIEEVKENELIRLDPGIEHAKVWPFKDAIKFVRDEIPKYFPEHSVTFFSQQSEKEINFKPEGGIGKLLLEKSDIDHKNYYYIKNPESKPRYLVVIKSVNSKIEDIVILATYKKRHIKNIIKKQLGKMPKNWKFNPTHRPTADASNILSK